MTISLIVSMKSGMTQFMERDIDGLIRRGHEVRLFSLLRNPGLIDPPENVPLVVASRVGAVLALIRWIMLRPLLMSKLVVHAIKFASLVDLAVAAQFYPRAGATDLVFAYFADHKLFVGYYLKRMTGKPLLTMVHAYELYRNPNSRMMREALAACDRILTVSYYNKERLTEFYDAPAERIEVIRQSLDLEAFRPSHKTKLLAVGFFNETKGYDVLLEALAILDREDIELWIVGDRNPSIRSVDVKKLAEERGVASQVAFFGAIKGLSLRALYRECDIFCLPFRTDKDTGHKEGFPTVLAEAMAFGKPIVTSVHSGIPEVVEEILVKESDPHELARALGQLLDTPETWHRHGARNREIAEAMFSVANHDRLASVISAVVESGSDSALRSSV